MNAKSIESELCLCIESDQSVWLSLVSSQHKALFWLFKAISSSTLTCCAIFSINMGGSWTSLDLNKLAIKTKSITKLPFILCHRGQIVDHLKQGIQLFTLWAVFLVYWLRSVMPILLVGGPLQNHHQDERIWDPASDSRHRFYTGILENDKRLEMFTRWQ